MIPEFGEKLPNVEYKDRPGAYALMFNEHNQIGLVELRGALFLPGGGIELGETPEQTVMREVEEETGWIAGIIQKIGQANQYFLTRSTKTYLHRMCHYFLVRPISNGSKIEHDHDLIWMTPEEAKKKLYLWCDVWAVEQVMAP